MCQMNVYKVNERTLLYWKKEREMNKLAIENELQ